MKYKVFILHYRLSIIQYSLALVLFMLPTMLMAQLRVVEGSFDERPMDTNTSTETDQNGAACALIKITVPPMGLELFHFDGGALGIRKIENTGHGNEIWLHVPYRAERLTISHPQFRNEVVFEYTIQLKKGTNYELRITVDGGRFVTIITPGVENADISVDGIHRKKQELINMFLEYGRHTVSGIGTGTKSRYEGSMEFTVEEGEQTQIVSLQLTDQSVHFGQVTVTVKDDPNAEILFQNDRKAAGTWRTELREGRYEIITRRKDCDDSRTEFTVKPQQQNNVEAKAPLPHTGNLLLHVRPRGTQAIYDNNKTFDFTQGQQAMTVGTHLFSFSRKGYVTQDNYSVNILKDQLTTDTIQLEAINYLKSKWAFYFGAGYTVQSLPGLTAYAGGVYKNFDLQLSYTLGLGSSKDVYNYDKSYELLSGNTYKMNAFAARVGYQFRMIPRLGITPQVGYMQQMLSATVSRGTGKYADGAKASSLTLGAKILAVPSQFVYLFVTPEYALELSKDATFDKVAQAADFQAGGFSVSVGVMINIGK